MFIVPIKPIFTINDKPKNIKCKSKSKYINKEFDKVLKLEMEGHHRDITTI